MRSRDVLADCRLALTEFQSAGANEAQWRIRWVALVALLRSVGYVLYSIDREQSSEWKKAVDEAWTRCNDMKPEPKILREFIEDERNNVIHMYKIGARLNTNMMPGGATMGFSPSIAAYQKKYATTYESFMRSGSFSGRDALELCQQAIEFWEQYLDDVEAAATKAR